MKSAVLLLALIGLAALAEATKLPEASVHKLRHHGGRRHHANPAQMSADLMEMHADLNQLIDVICVNVTDRPGINDPDDAFLCNEEVREKLAHSASLLLDGIELDRDMVNRLLLHLYAFYQASGHSYEKTLAGFIHALYSTPSKV